MNKIGIHEYSYLFAGNIKWGFQFFGPRMAMIMVEEWNNWLNKLVGSDVLAAEWLLVLLLK